MSNLGKVSEEERAQVRGEFDLSRFSGNLLVLVENYVRDERLQTQADIDEYARILVEAKEQKERGDQMMHIRSFIERQTIDRIRNCLDIYNDPDYYDIVLSSPGVLLDSFEFDTQE